MNTIYLENVSNMYVFIIRLLWNVQYTPCTPATLSDLIMMIIRGMPHGGIYFRWCSLLPKKARKMRRRTREVSIFLTDPPPKSVKIS